MEAPAYVCRALSRLNPNLRLAWDGATRSFAIVELYPQRLVGDLDEPSIISDLWHITDRYDPKTKEVYRVKVDRGPIFNMKGGLSPDWDMLNFVPVYKANLKSYEITTEEVFSLAFLKVLARWMIPFKQRQVESAIEAQRNLDRSISDLTREGYSRLKFQQHRGVQTNPIVPYKYAREELKAFYEDEKPLSDHFTRGIV